ncbi:MAG: hypothetical protein GEU93_00810 [Propionibacteriales bacterium]|nr:hypothetical protein [Propionibacteriales bacterium]
MTELPTGAGYVAAAVLPVGLLLAVVALGRVSSLVAGLLSLLAALALSALIFRADASVLGIAMAKGVWRGLWIVGVLAPALLIYRLSQRAGVERLGEAMTLLVPRNREKLLLVAWVFPSFIQGVAGFGAPIALTAPLLVALGWSPVRAVAYPLVGYHWSVTFGSMGASYYIARLTTGIDAQTGAWFTLWAAVMLAVNCLVAGCLVLLMDGGLRAVREGMRALLIVGPVMGAVLVGVTSLVPAVGTLTAGAAGMVVMVALASRDRMRARTANAEAGNPGGRLSAEHVWVFAPYAALMTMVLAIFTWPPVRAWTEDHLLIAPSLPATETGYGWSNEADERFNPIAIASHPGTYILLAAVAGYLLYRRSSLVEPGSWAPIARAWLRSIPRSAAPVLMLTSLAAVLVDSGMMATFAVGASEAMGTSYALLVPVVGALGTFVTGSTLTSNALFGPLQHQVATRLDLDTAVFLGAQTAGGNVGNAIAPVGIHVGAAAVDAEKRTSEILRTTATPVLVLLAVLVTITYVAGTA